MINTIERQQYVDCGGGGFSSREFAPQNEVSPITPDSLYRDNRSDKAHDNMTDWDLNKFDGSHIVTGACSDARGEIPDDKNSEVIQTIGAGGPKDPYKNLLSGRNISGAVNLGHHDGDTVHEEVVPEGCKGRGLKGEIETNGKQEHPTGKYVETNIRHKDLIIQTAASAIEIAAMTDVPVLGATQDHLTGEIYPLFASWTHRDTRYAITNRSITTNDILNPNAYDPKKIYQDGLPCINFNQLPEIFQEYLMKNRKEMDDLHERFPDYRQLQKTQNPDTVFITTDIRPVRLKFPTSFDRPGSVFRATMPRIKNSKGEDIGLEFSDEEIDKVFQQVWFPITQFSNVKNIIVETADIGWSEKIGCRLKDQEWMRTWALKQGAQILAIESRGGKINRPEILRLAA